jgi:2-dehydro-3-deoxyphosphogluconate aldolase / (4S)-4-hydroxy-2-oxoglutarate aldolase
MTDPRELASHGPVIPVIVLHRVEDAVPLAQALLAGGVRVLEVTLRTPWHWRACAAIVRAVPEAIVGAGTMRRWPTPRAPRTPAAASASARATQRLGHACRNMGLPLLPGVATASEVMAANADGY